jgi:nucleoside-diphosphate-sugar epimerase
MHGELIVSTYIQPSFAMSSIHPAIVLGPPVYLPADPAKLALSLKPIHSIYSGQAKILPPLVGTSSYVDVRDVAQAHLWAYEHPKLADGERYITSGGYGPAQGIADILRERYPEKQHIMAGEPGKGYVEGTNFCGKKVKVWYPKERPQLSGKKVFEVMGIEWIPMVESVIDTAEAFAKLYHI